MICHKRTTLAFRGRRRSQRVPTISSHDRTWLLLFPAYFHGRFQPKSSRLAAPRSVLLRSPWLLHGSVGSGSFSRPAAMMPAVWAISHPQKSSDFIGNFRGRFCSRNPVCRQKHRWKINFGWCLRAASRMSIHVQCGPVCLSTP